MKPEEARLRKLQRKKRCEHVHLSGRRCTEVIDPKKKLCKLHPDNVIVTHKGTIYAVCADCSSMLQTFTPPKGW